jgi:hypothetical protein
VRYSLVTDFMNLKIKSAKSFEGAHVIPGF